MQTDLDESVATDTDTSIISEASERSRRSGIEKGLMKKSYNLISTAFTKISVSKKVTN